MEEKIKYIYEVAGKDIVKFFGIFTANKKDYVKPAPFHYKISDILLYGKTHFCIEAFRESGKTSLVMSSFPKYLICYPKEDLSYIVFIKQNQTLAEQKVKEISHEAQANPLISCFIKDVVKDSGNVFCAEIKGYNGVEIEFRIEGYGKGSSVRGLIYKDRRPDLVILDDIQDIEDIYSDLIVERDWQWFNSEIMFLGKKSRVFVIGNNLGDKCITERIMQLGQAIGFETMRVPALDENMNPTWPSKYTLDELLREKEAYRVQNLLDVWYRERMCVSVPEETKVFKQEYFKYITEQELEEKLLNSNIYILWDAAISQSRDACNTAMVVIAVDSENKIYVVDVVYGKMGVEDALYAIFELVNKYKRYARGAFEVYIEQEKLSIIFKNLVLNKQRKDNIWFKFEEIRPGKSKEARIMGLQPRFKAGNIFFKKGAPWLHELEGQLSMFPRGKNVDIIDALAYVEYVAKPFYDADRSKEEYDRYYDNIDFSPL